MGLIPSARHSSGQAYDSNLLLFKWDHDFALPIVCCPPAPRAACQLHVEYLAGTSIVLRNKQVHEKELERKQKEQ